MKNLIFLILFMINLLASAGQIIVGVVRFAPPYTSQVGNSNYYYGFCIDLMDEICARLHQKCKYKKTEFDQQLSDLRQGLIDVTFLPSPITSTEDLDYLYSMPYLPSTGQFMTLNDSNIQALADLDNKKIGVLKFSLLKGNFLARYTSLQNVFEYPNLTQMITALNTNKIDAILLNVSVVKFLAHNIGNLVPLGKPIQMGDGYGITALKKNAELIGNINHVLLQLEADGTYAKIYNKYFGD